jgi:hypothetical protein
MDKARQDRKGVFTVEETHRQEIESALDELEAETGKPPAAETLTGQSALAYRLAAVVLFLNALISVGNLLLAWLLDLPTELAYSTIIPVLIDLGLAIGLLQLRKGARTWVLIRAGFGAVVWPIFIFISNDPISAVIMTLMQWGFCGPLILLLTGQSKTWRLVLAMAIFALVVLGLFSLMMLTAVAGFLM